MELWLNNYLALFFDFKNFGNLNWLVFPLLVYFLITIKKRKKWEKAIVLVLFLSIIAVGSVTGRSNLRHILTLHPFTLATILLFGWELIKKGKQYIQISVLIICGIFVIFNFHNFRDSYKRFWKYKVSFEDYYFPQKLFKYINNIEDLSAQSIFLVCSHNGLFYYHGNKRGIDFRDPKLSIFYTQKDMETALDVLKNQLKIKYILLHQNFKSDWFRILQNVIVNNCDLVYQEKFLHLYKLREKDLEKEELEKLFVNNSLLKNGSFENWSAGPFKNPDSFRGGEENTSREEKEVMIGKYSAKITGDNFNFFQNLSNLENYRGKKITCFAWIKTSTPNKFRMEIYDGIKSNFSKIHWGGGDWELLQANHTISHQAEFVNIRVIQAANTGGVNDVVYVDGTLLVEGDWNTYYQYSLCVNKKK
jgi:hypothetical protein